MFTVVNIQGVFCVMTPSSDIVMYQRFECEDGSSVAHSKIWYHGNSVAHLKIGIMEIAWPV
jgi:hypothetical protein